VGHPTDADREEGARDVLLAALTTLTAGDGAGFAALLRDDAAWLSAEGRTDGAEAAETARRFATGLSRWWSEPQQKGAHAVLRWAATEEDMTGHGALVVETRGGRIVFVAEVP
jgi:hypothetical protein